MEVLSKLFCVDEKYTLMPGSVSNESLRQSHEKGTWLDPCGDTVKKQSMDVAFTRARLYPR